MNKIYYIAVAFLFLEEDHLLLSIISIHFLQWKQAQMKFVVLLQPFIMVTSLQCNLYSRAPTNKKNVARVYTGIHKFTLHVS